MNIFFCSSKINFMKFVFENVECYYIFYFLFNV